MFISVTPAQDVTTSIKTIGTVLDEIYQANDQQGVFHKRLTTIVRGLKTCSTSETSSGR